MTEFHNKNIKGRTKNQGGRIAGKRKRYQGVSQDQQQTTEMSSSASATQDMDVTNKYTDGQEYGDEDTESSEEEQELGEETRDQIEDATEQYDR